MTSKITTVYDQVRSVIATLLSSRTEIRDPEDLGSNPVHLLKNGWGVRGWASRSEPSQFNVFTEVKTVIIVLTKEYQQVANSTATYHANNKALLEDVYTLQKDFMNQDQIEIEASIERIDSVSTSEITKIDTGKENFRYIEVTFDIWITETI